MLNFIRSRYFAKTATLFGIIATVSSASIAISSQHKLGGARADQSPNSYRERNACLVYGGWSSNVSSVSSPSKVNKVLTTFDSGGAVAEIDKDSLRTGLGSWNYEEGDRRKVVYTFLKHLFPAPANSYAGMVQITHYIVFNSAFDGFSGYSNVTRFSQDGNATQIERAGNVQGFLIKADVPVGIKAAPNIP